MSVAFRREQDDEHLEPKFELPIPPGPNLVTSRGLALTEAKVAEFEALLPTLTDEAEIKSAKRRLRYWRTRLGMAQLVDAPDGSVVRFGCRVNVRMNGAEKVIAIVGDDEADPAQDLYSFSAPICRAIMDSEVGEWVDFGGKAEAIEILSIEPII